MTRLMLGGISVGRIVEPQERDRVGTGGYGFELDLPPRLQLSPIIAAGAIDAALQRRAAARNLEVARAMR